MLVECVNHRHMEYPLSPCVNDAFKKGMLYVCFIFHVMAEYYWKSLLDLACDCNAPPSDSEEQSVMVEVLIENEFERLQDLRFSGSPQRWAGVHRLSNDALAFLEDWQRDVIRMAEKR